MSTSDMGSVDLFGLDEFGQPTGSLWQYGAVIGAMSQTGGAMLFRNVIGKTNVKMFKYSELLGAGVSALAGGVLYFMGEQTAGMAAGLSGLVAGGLRQLEFNTMMTRAKALGLGSGFGYATIDPQYLVPGSKGLMGLGLPAVEPSAQVTGGLGGAMPTLVGDYGLSANPGANNVSLQGGPNISGLGAHYGATLFQ